MSMDCSLKNKTTGTQRAHRKIVLKQHLKVTGKDYQKIISV